MKGLGAVFVVLVMALAGIGAGYATFYDKVTVHGIAESGHLEVGIAAIGTNDDSDNSDGVPNNPGNFDPYYNGEEVVQSNYDTAYTNVWNDTWKFKIGETSFYEKMHVVARKVYPNYAPTINFAVGVKNDWGSVPARIKGFVFEFKEKNLTSDKIVAEGKITGIGEDGNPVYDWTIKPSENTIIYNPETGWPNFDVVSYAIYGHNMPQGEGGSSLQDLLEMKTFSSITISPGQVMYVTITMYFKDIPQDHYLEGNLTLNYMDFHFSSGYS